MIIMFLTKLNLVTINVIKSMSCTMCHLYHINENCEDKCSACFKGWACNWNPSFEQLLTSEDATIPNSVYEMNVKILFRHYIKSKLGNNYVLIDSENKYEMFWKLCGARSYDYFKDFLVGKCDYPPVFFMSEYLDRLFGDLESKVDSKIFYMYVHCAAVRVVNIWKSKSRNGVLLCYHKDFGDFVECPGSYKALVGRWRGCA